MKFVCFALLLLIASKRSPGQSAFGGFSFGESASSGSQAHFGLEAPGFPDTSARRLELEAVSPPAAPAPPLRYAYPVRPLRFGAEAPPTPVPGARSPAEARQLTLVFRNQTIDAASACWIEGKTLHYINSFNSPETIPVKRVNWKLTEATDSIKPGTLISRLEK
jgi:hypothetical protein